MWKPLGRRAFTLATRYCIDAPIVSRVKVERCAESLASAEENNLKFQAGTQEVGGQIQNSSKTRTNELKAHYLPFTPTHARSHSHSLLPLHQFNSVHKVKYKDGEICVTTTKPLHFFSSLSLRA